MISPRAVSTLDTLKTQLRATDEEWKVIGPKVRKVMSARRAAQAGLMTGDEIGRGFFQFNREGEPPGFGPPGRPPFDRDSFSGPGGPGEFGPGRDRPFPRGGNREVTSRPATEPRRRDGPERNQADDVRMEANRRSVPSTRPGMGRGGTREENRPPGPGFPGAGGEITRAMSELQKTAGHESSVEQLRPKIEAVRLAREKAKKELESARKELLQLLTPDQEAMLIALGYLE